MPKNPFVTLKGRRKKKYLPSKPVVVPDKVKPYCPRSMVRYDNVPVVNTMWACKHCLKCLLSENAVKDHIIPCKIETTKSFRPSESPEPTNEENRYVCKYCDQYFARLVTLKSHEKQHNRSSSSSSETDVEDQG